MTNGQTEGDAKKHVSRSGVPSLDEANGQTEGDDSSYEYLVPICGGVVMHEWYIIVWW